MDICSKQEGTSVHIDLEGSIDEQGAEKMKEFLSSLSINGIDEVVAHFQKVSYIGSSGIGKLLLFYKNLGVQHVSFKVVEVPLPIYELFLELKLDTIFPVAKH